MLEELDYLQDNIAQALNTIRVELKAHNLPPLSHQAILPHPLDDAGFVCPPRLYEARRLALGKCGYFIATDILRSRSLTYHYSSALTATLVSVITSWSITTICTEY